MPYRNALYLIAAMQVTHVIDFMLLMPLGPQLIRLFNVTPTQFSVLIASYAFAAGISGFAVAMIADRFDRKRLLLFVYAGLTVATLACAIAPSFQFLLAARIVAGVFGGVMSSISFAIVGDLIPPSHRGRAMGMLGVSFPIASTLGVPFSLLLAQWFGWHAPFFALCALCVVLQFFAWKLLPSVSAHLQPAGHARRSGLRTLWEALINPNHTAAYALTAIITYSGFSVIPFIAPVLIKNGVLAETLLPLAYGIGGLATFFSVQWVGKWADRYGKRRVFMIASALSMLPILLVTHATPAATWIVLVQWVMFMVFTSARWTPALALVTGATTAAQRGSFLAVNTSVMQFASSLGTFISGLILTQNANGTIGNYPIVGYISVAIACVGFWVVRKVRAVS